MFNNKKKLEIDDYEETPTSNKSKVINLNASKFNPLNYEDFDEEEYEELGPPYRAVMMMNQMEMEFNVLNNAPFTNLLEIEEDEQTLDGACYNPISRHPIN